MSRDGSLAARTERETASQPVHASSAAPAVVPERSRARRSFWQVFGTPTILAVVSTVGLIAALIGDGLYDAVSWITLAIPVVVIARFLK